MHRFGVRDKMCWMPCFRTRNRFTADEEGSNNRGHVDSRG